MRAAAGQSSAASGARTIPRKPGRPAPSRPRLLLGGLVELRRLALGRALALGQLLGARTLGADADRRLLLLRFDDRQPHVALVLLGGWIDHHGRPRGQLLPQDEVGERVLDVALYRPAQRARAH